jgi:hypothetical protein
MYVFQVRSCRLVYRLLEFTVDYDIAICDVTTLKTISLRDHAL